VENGKDILPSLGPQGGGLRRQILIHCIYCNGAERLVAEDSDELMCRRPAARSTSIRRSLVDGNPKH